MAADDLGFHFSLHVLAAPLGILSLPGQPGHPEVASDVVELGGKFMACAVSSGVGTPFSTEDKSRIPPPSHPGPPESGYWLMAGPCESLHPQKAG